MKQVFISLLFKFYGQKVKKQLRVLMERHFCQWMTLGSKF